MTLPVLFSVAYRCKTIRLVAQIRLTLSLRDHPQVKLTGLPARMCVQGPAQ